MAPPAWASSVTGSFRSLVALLVAALVVSAVYLSSGQPRLRSPTPTKQSHQCDLFYGRWVYDNESYPLYKEKDCPYMSEQHACEAYGRKDLKYRQWRWQPHGCHLSRAEDWGGLDGHSCYQETEPITREGYSGSGLNPELMRVVEAVINRLRTRGLGIQILNITQLSEYRKDAHPSIYKRQWHPLSPEQLANPTSYFDCFHWSLPGVSDVWNELLCAYIL